MMQQKCVHCTLRYSRTSTCRECASVSLRTNDNKVLKHLGANPATCPLCRKREADQAQLARLPGHSRRKVQRQA